MGPYLYFRVLIFTFLASFTQRMSIQSACIQQWFRFKLLANFDFHLCLRINFHTSSFWVLILAASGPYFTKNGSLLGPYLKAWGSLLVLEAVETSEARRLPWEHPNQGVLKIVEKRIPLLKNS